MNVIMQHLLSHLPCPENWGWYKEMHLDGAFIAIQLVQEGFWNLYDQHIKYILYPDFGEIYAY